MANRPPGRSNLMDANTKGTHAFVCFVNGSLSCSKIFSARSCCSLGRYWYRINGGFPTTASNCSLFCASNKYQRRKSLLSMRGCNLLEAPAFAASAGSSSQAVIVFSEGIDSSSTARKNAPSPQLGSNNDSGSPAFIHFTKNCGEGRLGVKSTPELLFRFKLNKVHRVLLFFGVGFFVEALVCGLVR